MNGEAGMMDLRTMAAVDDSDRVLVFVITVLAVCAVILLFVVAGLAIGWLR